MVLLGFQPYLCTKDGTFPTGSDIAGSRDFNPGRKDTAYTNGQLLLVIICAHFRFHVPIGGASKNAKNQELDHFLNLIYCTNSRLPSFSPATLADIADFF